MESLSHNRLKQITKYFNLHNQIKKYTVLSKPELIAELKKHLVLKDGILDYKERLPFNQPLKEKSKKPTRNLFKESEQNINIIKEEKPKEEEDKKEQLLFRLQQNLNIDERGMNKLKNLSYDELSKLNKEFIDKKENQQEKNRIDRLNYDYKYYQDKYVWKTLSSEYKQKIIKDFLKEGFEILNIKPYGAYYKRFKSIIDPESKLIKEEETLSKSKTKPKEEEQPEFDELTPEEIEDERKLLEYYSENPSEFLSVPLKPRTRMLQYWEYLGYKLPKQLEEVIGSGKPQYKLHAVIVHKPYPLEKAYQEAMHIMKISKPKFMRETGQSYRFRNIPKTKFQSKSFRTKVINPHISLVWGNLK